MDGLFQKYKTQEQDDLKNQELRLLRQSLADAQKDFERILFLKRHFMQGGQYSHLLKTWQTDLDSIFKLAKNHQK